MPVTYKHEFIRQLKDALGLPPRCRSWSLHVDINAAVWVRCEYFPSPDAMETVTHHFRLEQIAEEPVSP